MAQMVQSDRRDPKGQQDLKEIQEIPDHKDLKETLEIQGHKDPQVLMALQALKGLQDRKDRKDQPDHRVILLPMTKLYRRMVQQEISPFLVVIL